MATAEARVRDEAAAWVALQDAGDWSEGDEARLQAWLAVDPRRHGLLLQAQAAWMTLDPPSDKATATVSGLGRRRLLSAGGTALAASLVGGLLWVRRWTDYATAIGEIRRVPLADGSIAAINTDSKIEIRFVDRRREVRLAQGETWFQVAKDASRPFVVDAGGVFAQAVGTAFSVRRRDDGAEILVTEGIVDVWADRAAGRRIRLAAGERAFVARDARIEHEAAGPSSVDRKLAWRAGKVDLFGETLADAIAEFNRYNQRQLVLTDPTLGSEQFDGVFRTDDPLGFAIAIHHALGVAVDTSKSEQIRIGRSVS